MKYIKSIKTDAFIFLFLKHNNSENSYFTKGEELNGIKIYKGIFIMQ